MSSMLVGCCSKCGGCGRENGVHRIAGGESINEVLSGDGVAGFGGESFEGLGGEVVDVIGIAKATPACSADVSVDAGVVGNLDDNQGVRCEGRCECFEEGEGLGFVFEEGGHYDEVDGSGFEAGSAFESIGEDDSATECGAFFVGELGEVLGDFDAERNDLSADSGEAGMQVMQQVSRRAANIEDSQGGVGGCCVADGKCEVEEAIASGKKSEF